MRTVERKHLRRRRFHADVAFSAGVILIVGDIAPDFIGMFHLTHNIHNETAFADLQRDLNSLRDSVPDTFLDDNSIYNDFNIVAQIAV